MLPFLISKPTPKSLISKSRSLSCKIILNWTLIIHWNFLRIFLFTTIFKFFWTRLWSLICKSFFNFKTRFYIFLNKIWFKALWHSSLTGRTRFYLNLTWLYVTICFFINISYWKWLIFFLIFNSNSVKNLRIIRIYAFLYNLLSLDLNISNDWCYRFSLLLCLYLNIYRDWLLLILLILLCLIIFIIDWLFNLYMLK